MSLGTLTPNTPRARRPSFRSCSERRREASTSNFPFVHCDPRHSAHAAACALSQRGGRLLQGRGRPRRRQGVQGTTWLIGWDVDDIILNFDPAKPHARFGRGASCRHLDRNAAVPPRCRGRGPLRRPRHSRKPRRESDDLSRFKGYDAVVVTWTAAEASAMATLFTPGHPLADWYEYRHDVESYVPLVTGTKAPFNDSRADMARYYHSLGLYFPCTIRDKRVLLFKSGLHLDYDGPAMPGPKLMAEIAQAVEPKIFITTGTGGGIGRTSSSATSSLQGRSSSTAQPSSRTSPGRRRAIGPRPCRPARSPP